MVGWTMLDMSFYFLAFSGGSVQKLGKHTHTVDDASSCQFLGIDTGNVPREIPRLHAHHTASPFAGKLPGRLFEFQKPKEHEASESKKNMSSIYHGSILPRTNSEKQRARSKKIFNHTPNITQYLTSYSGPPVVEYSWTCRTKRGIRCINWNDFEVTWFLQHAGAFLTPFRHLSKWRSCGLYNSLWQRNQDSMLVGRSILIHQESFVMVSAFSFFRNGTSCKLVEQNEDKQHLDTSNSLNPCTVRK